ncbi:hypothetical protein RHGRI_037676 [Rhododendron griersonianum]|uniref:Uncharacterized protein n=1 Tax=Rhododendron griersonianum TaxID=479676 RepID=A0AAV6HT08_9ERIC|nr:hypothetical protein RHGRI_037676 [Rhododendron griersonianum]
MVKSSGPLINLLVRVSAHFYSSCSWQLGCITSGWREILVFLEGDPEELLLFWQV